MVTGPGLAHDGSMSTQMGGQATETPPPAPFTRPRRRLCRDPRHRRIGGVASGLASFVGIDTTVMRVLFAIVTAVTGGTAIVGYLIGVLVAAAGAWLAWGAGYGLLLAGGVTAVSFLLLYEVEPPTPPDLLD